MVSKEQLLSLASVGVAVVDGKIKRSDLGLTISVLSAKKTKAEEIVEFINANKIAYSKTNKGNDNNTIYLDRYYFITWQAWSDRSDKEWALLKLDKHLNPFKLQIASAPTLNGLLKAAKKNKQEQHPLL